jgi:hypothetical protein
MSELRDVPRTVSRQTVEIFLREVASLGFSTNLVPRDSNPYPTASLSGWPESVEQNMRQAIPDNAEFVIPVHLAPQSFVGFELADFSPLKATEHAQHLMETAQVLQNQVCQSAGLPYGRDDYAYLDGTLRPSSFLAWEVPGLMRGGLLAVCREGIAIVGLVLHWLPEQYHARGLLQQIPPAGVTFEFRLISYVAYRDMQEVRQVELVRFDGLAALLYGVMYPSIGQQELLGNEGAGRSGIEYLRCLNRRDTGRDSFPSPQKGLAKGLRSLSESVRPGTTGWMPSPMQWFVDLAEYLRAQGLSLSNFVPQLFNQTLYERVIGGWMASGGTGYENGNYRRCLFNSALGLVFVNKTNGSKYGVESNFAEIDAALELIQHQISSGLEADAAKEQASASSPHEMAQLDVAGQLEKLASLFASGVLTADEFTAAKARVLSQG